MLHKFSADRGKTSIQASKLDENFAQCYPVQQSGNARHYLMTYSAGGWSMRIFPEFPNGGGLYVLAWNNGEMSWYPTLNCP